jgi:hypothetical protein
MNPRPARKAQECDCYVQCYLHINARRLLNTLRLTYTSYQATVAGRPVKKREELFSHIESLLNDCLTDGEEMLRECRGVK